MDETLSIWQRVRAVFAPARHWNATPGHAMERLAHLGMVSAGIAHEINTPLMIISLTARRMEELGAVDALAPSDIVEGTRKIGAMADRIAAIVKSMRDMSRNASGDAVEDTPVAALVESAVALCRPGLEAADVRLVDPTPLPEVRVRCRPIEISQVVVNLLVNAVDAVLSRDERWIKLEIEAVPGFVHIAVVDSGAGVSPEHRGKIMEPFFTTKDTGTGIGLALAREIVRRHQGSLTLDAGSSHTRFVVALPTV